MSRKVILLGAWPPPYGGVAIFTSTLFEYIKDYGVKLWIYGGKEIEDSRIRFIKYKRLGIIPQLIKDAFKARIADSSHFLVEHPNLVLVPSWVFSKLLLRFEWLKIIHDGSLPSRYKGFSPVQKLLFKLAIRSVNEFIVVNDNINSWLCNEIKVKQKVSTINALLPLPHRSFSASLPAEIERSFARYSKRVCSTGVFIPSYGFKQVADSLEKIRQESGENIGLIIIDGTFICDESYRSEVLRQREWITVLENMPHPLVLQIFKQSDVFVRGFRFEGYGLSRIEAIWCGTPVVAAQGEESRGMLLYDYGDEEELIRQIKKTLFNPPEQEVQKWARQFQLEAEENLRRWMRVLGLSS